MVAVFHEPGALDRTVHHRLGDRSGADLLAMRVIEHAVHGWDLARAIGADDRIDPPVTSLLLATLDDQSGPARAVRRSCPSGWPWTPIRSAGCSTLTGREA